MRTNSLPKFMAEDVLTSLNNVGLRCYLYCLAYSGSIYIKFKDEFLGTLRIAIHAGIPKYSYKWNLRSDIDNYYEEIDRGVLRKYYPLKDLDIMIKDLLEM